MSFFFFLFLFLNLVHFSLKPQNIEMLFLCKVVELQTQFFLPKVFGATPPETPSKMGPQKSIFLTAQVRALVFLVSGYI